MSKINDDITGLNFGHLRAELLHHRDNQGRAFWLCRCDCGNKKVVAAYNLKSNRTKSCGCLRHKKPKHFQDLTGAKFGQWTVEKENGRNKQGKVLWLCTCNCGNTTNVTADNLQRNHSKSCGCLAKGEFANNWKGYKNFPLTYWSQIKNGAFSRKIPFLISIEYALELFEKQSRKCALSGLPLELLVKHGTASIDRIDSNIGYLEHNIQWVHKDINRMKSWLNQNYFLNICGLATKHNTTEIEKLNLPIPAIKNNSYNWNGHACMSGNFIYGLKQNAIKRNLSFKVTPEQLWKMYLDQGGRCSITGMPIHFGTSWEKTSITASLDRTNSLKNYTLDNVSWVHKDVNLVKSNFELTYFVNICQLIYNTHNLCDSQLLKPSTDWHESFKFSDSKEHNINRQKRSNCRSKFKGVYISNVQKPKMYHATLTIDNKRVLSQWFDNEITAAKHFDYFSIMHHGNKCFLNFPNENYSNFSPILSRKNNIKKTNISP